MTLSIQRVLKSVMPLSVLRVSSPFKTSIKTLCLDCPSTCALCDLALIIGWTSKPTINTVMTITAGTAAIGPPSEYKTNKNKNTNGKSANATSVADAIKSFRESNSFTVVAIAPVG